MSSNHCLDCDAFKGALMGAMACMGAAWIALVSVALLG